MLQKGKLKFIQLIEGKSRVEAQEQTNRLYIPPALWLQKEWLFYFFKIIRWEGVLGEICSWLSFPNLDIMALDPDKRRYCKRCHNLRSGSFSRETRSVVPPPLPSIPRHRLTASRPGRVLARPAESVLSGSSCKKQQPLRGSATTGISIPGSQAFDPGNLGKHWVAGFHSFLPINFPTPT